MWWALDLAHGVFVPSQTHELAIRTPQVPDFDSMIDGTRYDSVFGVFVPVEREDLVIVCTHCLYWSGRFGVPNLNKLVTRSGGEERAGVGRPLCRVDTVSVFFVSLEWVGGLRIPLVRQWREEIDWVNEASFQKKNEMKWKWNENEKRVIKVVKLSYLILKYNVLVTYIPVWSNDPTIRSQTYPCSPGSNAPKIPPVHARASFVLESPYLRKTCVVIG